MSEVLVLVCVNVSERLEQEKLDEERRHLEEMSEDEYDALSDQQKAAVDRQRLEIKKQRLQRFTVLLPQLLITYHDSDDYDLNNNNIIIIIIAHTLCHKVMK